MRAESDWATAIGVGRIQDKTRWTKAVGEAVTVVYGDYNEDIELSNIVVAQWVLTRPGNL